MCDGRTGPTMDVAGECVLLLLTTVGWLLWWVGAPLALRLSAFAVPCFVSLSSVRT